MKYELTKLNAPEGATSIHHEGHDYDVADGVVEVPKVIADDLKGSHGYVDYAPAVKAEVVNRSTKK